ncbi:hypothetical protein BLI708_00370 [Bifidobacterium imperatoris]|uniref:Uncharacterized protein n=1 Tax=Bifidobacterium imperatoris TaxID=2020965 RepID=A0A2N5IPC0_9BIFI|nr:hypothetical protein [Bifidobacterium imperatoris]PLS23786.1 hypothetical protein Tam1G_2158 [Bifidobacterium imperatoris]QSY57782.1 hypothetical protein BLI708_00070 [Bifidobacterium imperatoris]QSY57832.1 hypothetical protein BLI708_00370 [Bifidobacterium imperatoris]
MKTSEAKDLIWALLPSMPHWRVYEDVATGPAPPWIVWRVRSTDRTVNEAVNVTSRLFELDIRVVAAYANDVDSACEAFMTALDGVHPRGMGALVPYSDSGVYASELTDPETGQAYVMRVISWRFGQ